MSRTWIKETLSILIALFSIGGSSAVAKEWVDEASAVAIDGEKVYFVGNAADDVYFVLPIPVSFPDEGFFLMDTGYDDASHPGRIHKLNCQALDPEGISVLGEDVFVLSEGNSKSVVVNDDGSGLVGCYERQIEDVYRTEGEKVKVGMEGLAVRKDSSGEKIEISALFEGGWNKSKNGGEGVPVRIYRHIAGSTDYCQCESTNASSQYDEIELTQEKLRGWCLPDQEPDDKEFTVRGTDLVYYPYAKNDQVAWGYIILLSATLDGYHDHKWLLKLDEKGEPMDVRRLKLTKGLAGKASDLEANNYGAAELNWEGLCWRDGYGSSLVMVADDDHDGPREDDGKTTVYVYPFPDQWLREMAPTPR